MSVLDDDHFGPNNLLFQKTLKEQASFRMAGSNPNPQCSYPCNQIEADFQAAQQHNLFFKTMQDKNKKDKKIMADPDNLRFSSPNVASGTRKASSEICDNTPFKKPTSSYAYNREKVFDAAFAAADNQRAQCSENQLHETNKKQMLINQ